MKTHMPSYSMGKVYTIRCHTDHNLFMLALVCEETPLRERVAEEACSAGRSTKGAQSLS